MNLMYQIIHVTISLLSMIKSAAQTKQMSFPVTDKDILGPECYHRQEIACTSLKERFQEGRGKGFLTNCILRKLSINQQREKIYRLYVNTCIWL
jgi:hypothetical protein